MEVNWNQHSPHYYRDDHYGGRDFRGDDYGDRPHRGFRGGHGPRGGGGGGGGHPGPDGGDDGGQPTMMSFKAFLGSQVRFTLRFTYTLNMFYKRWLIRDDRQILENVKR